MATVLNTIYPPQVETFMPSFCYNDSAKVWFNISSYNEDMISKIKFIHVSMVDQRNNANVFAGINDGDIVYPQYYPIAFNGIKLNNNNLDNKMGYDPDKQMYWLVIPPQIIRGNVSLQNEETATYNTNQYYKIQLRFDLTGDDEYPQYSEEYKRPTDFFHWDGDSNKAANALGLALYTNYNQDNFSEWSRGTLIKPIFIPDLAIQTFDTSTQITINPSTDIPIVGELKFKKINGDYTKEENEQLSWYQIKILNDPDSDLETIEYLDTDKIYADKNQINSRINTSMPTLSINMDYQIRIIYETNNGYTETIDYPVKIVDYTNEAVKYTYSKSIDEENGIITINVNRLDEYNTGYLVVRRASHRTDFMEWELLAAKDISTISSWEFKDTTVESITGYRYQLQYMTDTEIYRPTFVEDNSILHCDFYGGLFSDNNKTLKLSFDFQVSNRSNAVNRTKTDTLGGQYPIFTQNSKLKYHTYTISGRISSEDDGELFLPKEEIFGSEYFNSRYNNGNNITDTSIFDGKTGSLTQIERIQPGNDWLYEREYRDAVEDWLNNGKPKLFRSMTEGNMVVMLDTVSLTPDTVLGRRLYNFSATMYEIGNGKNIESIASFGLFDVVDERKK